MFSNSWSSRSLVVAAALASSAATGLVSDLAAAGRFESTRAASHGFAMSQQTVGRQRGVDTVFVLPGSHLDVGYTDTPSRVREVRVEVIEDAIRAAQQDPEFRWFEEGGWAFDAWLQRYGQDEQRLATVRQLLQSGQLGVGATWLHPHAAAVPEAVGFLTLHLEELDSLFDYRPSVAVLNDPPSYPEALADALVASGIIQEFEVVKEDEGGCESSAHMLNFALRLEWETSRDRLCRALRREGVMADRFWCDAPAMRPRDHRWLSGECRTARWLARAIVNIPLSHVNIPDVKKAFDMTFRAKT
ncbi:MAG: hypothetical protein IH853_09755 [Bacteroidetes bacterium]|nr:hypothetical protein [Bacteroidota bacterium]